MTAQMADTLRYLGDEYSLIAVERGPLFAPQSLGLKPTMESSICWRGYVCRFEIRRDTLLLKRLLVHAENYPVIDGVEPGRDPYAAPRRLYESFQCYPLNRPLGYTGGLVAGSGMARNFHVNMGFQRAVAYTEVWELLFEHGKLQTATDRSREVEQLRQILMQRENQDLHGKQDVGDWVGMMFSLSYEDKYPF